MSEKSRETRAVRWLTSEQLGPHFDDGGEIALVEVLDQYRRRPVHRQKAHLHLSALRHRARELGDRAQVLSGPTHREALEQAGLVGDRLETVGAISWGMRRLIDELGGTMLEPRGFVTERAVFDDWAAGKKASQLVMDRFYREVRERTGLLMEGGGPVGGQFSFDAD
ncbi:MAG: cryptochrome/photolyase family protein, partial [Microcella sp.]